MAIPKLHKFKDFAKAASGGLELHSNAVIYTRVSSKEQADNNGSLATQKQYCESYAERQGLNVVGYFGGTYESAKSDERREFKRMLEFVKRKKNVSYIIVYSYDRFSRTGTNGAYISEQLMKQGIVTVSATQDVDPTSPSGAFQQNLYYMFGQFDNAQRRDKCVSGTIGKLRAGYWCTYPPLGYTNLNKGQRAENHKIVVNEQGKILRKAWHWKLKYDLPNIEIVSRLKKAGVPMTEKILSKTFRNPFYCGLVVHKLIPGEVIEGKHEAMVSRSVFLKANEMLEAKNNMRHGLKTDNLDQLPLKTFVKCDSCGKPMTGYLVHAKGKYYYKCRTRGCRNNRGRDQMHHLFVELLQQYQITEASLEHTRHMLKYTFQQVNKDMVEEMAMYSNRLHEIETKLEGMERRFVMGEIPKPLFDKYHGELKLEHEELLQKTSNSTLDSSNFDLAINSVTDIAVNLSDYWQSSDVNGKLKLQSLVFPEGIGYDRKNDRVRTFRVNTLFAPIPLITAHLGQNKKGESSNFSAFSLRVEPMARKSNFLAKDFAVANRCAEAAL